MREVGQKATSNLKTEKNPKRASNKGQREDLVNKCRVETCLQFSFRQFGRLERLMKLKVERGGGSGRLNGGGDESDFAGGGSGGSREEGMF